MSLRCRRRTRTAAAGCLALAAVLAAAGCGVATPGVPDPTARPKMLVVASIDAWGSILGQLGGDKVTETSIIVSPEVDPRRYRPSARDERRIAAARILVVNGINFDRWAIAAAVTAPQSQLLIDVGRVAGIGEYGNPHQCYSGVAVHRVADAITARLQQADPADSAYFAARHATFVKTALTPFDTLEATIRAKYRGTPVGASESLAEPLAAALGLDIRTPASYLVAVSQRQRPSAADIATVDDQIRTKKIKVYLDDVQDSTPEVAASVKAAEKANIPVVTLTETLSPQGATFQAWQIQQLTALRNALSETS